MYMDELEVYKEHVDELLKEEKLSLQKKLKGGRNLIHGQCGTEASNKLSGLSEGSRG